MTDHIAYVRQLEHRLRIEKKRAETAQDICIVLSVACFAMVILLVVVSNPI